MASSEEEDIPITVGNILHHLKIAVEENIDLTKIPQLQVDSTQDQTPSELEHLASQTTSDSLQDNVDEAQGIEHEAYVQNEGDPLDEEGDEAEISQVTNEEEATMKEDQEIFEEHPHPPSLPSEDHKAVKMEGADRQEAKSPGTEQQVLSSEFPSEGERKKTIESSKQEHIESPKGKQLQGVPSVLETEERLLVTQSTILPSSERSFLANHEEEYSKPGRSLKQVDDPYNASNKIPRRPLGDPKKLVVQEQTKLLKKKLRKKRRMAFPVEHVSVFVTVMLYP